MTTYHQIKAQELETTKSYSIKKMARYIRMHKLLLSCYSVNFFWTLSFIMFMAAPYFVNNTVSGYIITVFLHLLTWEFYIKNVYHKHTDSDKEELELVIVVLEDIKKEKEA